MFELNTDDLLIKPFFSVAGLATQLVFLIKDPEKPKGILLDIGDGTCRDILKDKLDFDWFNHIIISHGHYDHSGGLYSFLGVKRMLGSKKDITIVYPAGCKEVLNCINLIQNNYSDTMPYKIIQKPVSTKSVSEIDFGNDFPFTVKSFPVIHRGSTLSPGVLPLIPACGYQVYAKSKNFRIAFSGDTAPTPILYEIFNSDVDIGFIENTHPDESWVSDKVNRFHLTTAEALEFSKGCKKAVLIHDLPKHVLENRLKNN